MVDLVKIRKKAKSREATPRETAEPAHAAETPMVPEPESSTHVSAPAGVAAPAPVTSAKLDQFRETAGQRRDGFLASENEAASVETIELLTFLIAGEQYAVGIDHLVEIIKPRDATGVPNSDATIVGIISLRGTIVTVIDVRRKLRHPPAGRENDARIIVAERGSETLGFEVDRVLRVLKVPASSIEPHPVVHLSELTEAVRGVFRHGDALTIFLDLDKLLS
jgi:purine-binding chemotaxis protein CheW